MSPVEARKGNGFERNTSLLDYDDHVAYRQQSYWVRNVNAFELSADVDHVAYQKHLYWVREGNGFQLSAFSQR
jgi:hypothetical protein